MGGTCDEALTGETADEISQKGHEHVKNATDEAHVELLKKMEAISEEDLAKWKGEFQKTFDAAPTV